MKRFLFAGTSISLLCLSLTGCEVADNQLLVSSSRWEIANPSPVNRPFAANNSRHKLLMAVVDFGVDYNHPFLLNSMHFKLDENNHPIGLGYDFVADDSWPSPYIAMSADTDSNTSSSAKSAALNLTQHLIDILTTYPELKDSFSPYRRIEQEIDSGSFHGTHVAGLMTYDTNDLGLMSYRVLPANQVYRDGVLIEEEAGQNIVAAQVLRAVTMAIADGAKVINLSLGMDLNNDEYEADSPEAINFNTIQASLEIVIKNNPDVAFVASSGNSGNLIDLNSHRQLPCGIKADNILCVGALDTEGAMATFSNVVLSDSPFILAPGVDILSTIPTKFCLLKNDSLKSSETTALVLSSDAAPWDKTESAKEMIDNVAKSCKKNNGLMKASGTSMSAPIISRALALLRVKRPNLNASEAIFELLSQGEKYQEGQLTLTKIKLPLPSWSALGEPSSNKMLRKRASIEFISASSN